MFEYILLAIMGLCAVILILIVYLEIRDRHRSSRKRALTAFARKIKKMFGNPL